MRHVELNRAFPPFYWQLPPAIVVGNEVYRELYQDLISSLQDGFLSFVHLTFPTLERFLQHHSTEEKFNYTNTYAKLKTKRTNVVWSFLSQNVSKCSWTSKIPYRRVSVRRVLFKVAGLNQMKWTGKSRCVTISIIDDSLELINFIVGEPPVADCVR